MLLEFNDLAEKLTDHENDTQTPLKIMIWWYCLDNGIGTSGMISRAHLLKESKKSVQKWVRNNCLKFCGHNSPKKLQSGGCANNFENSNNLRKKPFRFIKFHSWYILSLAPLCNTYIPMQNVLLEHTYTSVHHKILYVSFLKHINMDNSIWKPVSVRNLGFPNKLM